VYTPFCIQYFRSSTANLAINISSQPGNALSFDGFDNRVLIPDAPILRSPVVSVELWVNLRELKTGFVEWF